MYFSKRKRFMNYSFYVVLSFVPLIASPAHHTQSLRSNAHAVAIASSSLVSIYAAYEKIAQPLQNDLVYNAEKDRVTAPAWKKIVAWLKEQPAYRPSTEDLQAAWTYLYCGMPAYYHGLFADHIFTKNSHPMHIVATRQWLELGNALALSPDQLREYATLPEPLLRSEGQLNRHTLSATIKTTKTMPAELKTRFNASALTSWLTLAKSLAEQYEKMCAAYSEKPSNYSPYLHTFIAQQRLKAEKAPLTDLFTCTTGSYCKILPRRQLYIDASVTKMNKAYSRDSAADYLIDHPVKSLPVALHTIIQRLNLQLVAHLHTQSVAHVSAVCRALHQQNEPNYYTKQDADLCMLWQIAHNLPQELHQLIESFIVGEDQKDTLTKEALAKNKEVISPASTWQLFNRALTVKKQAASLKKQKAPDKGKRKRLEQEEGYASIEADNLN
jgi:hypothetical protein